MCALRAPRFSINMKMTRFVNARIMHWNWGARSFVRLGERWGVSAKGVRHSHSNVWFAIIWLACHELNAGNSNPQDPHPYSIRFSHHFYSFYLYFACCTFEFEHIHMATWESAPAYEPFEFCSTIFEKRANNCNFSQSFWLKSFYPAAERDCVKMVVGSMRTFQQRYSSLYFNEQCMTVYILMFHSCERARAIVSHWLSRRGTYETSCGTEWVEYYFVDFIFCVWIHWIPSLRQSFHCWIM